MKILQGKIFGMPRWVFFILLAFGLAVGLYLRSRSAGTDEGDIGEEAEDYGGDEGMGPLDGIDEPGLAGAVGVASPPGGVYPVTTPIIPEGLTDVFGTLSGVIEGQGATIADLASIRYPDAVAQPEAPAVAPPTGGGPPKRPPQTVRRKPSKTEARRRVQAIAKKHGSRSAAATRARKRLGIKPPPPKKKRKRR